MSFALAAFSAVQTNAPQRARSSGVSSARRRSAIHVPPCTSGTLKFERLFARGPVELDEGNPVVLHMNHGKQLAVAPAKGPPANLDRKLFTFSRAFDILNRPEDFDGSGDLAIAFFQSEVVHLDNVGAVEWIACTEDEP